jgi:hypothetical protein
MVKKKFQNSARCIPGRSFITILVHLVADILQQMVKRAYESGFLKHPIPQGAPLPALQYLNDMLLLLHGSAHQAIFAKQLLDATITRLQINFQKSTFVPLHTSDQEANEVASVLGCPITQLCCTYLGLPLSVCEQNVTKIVAASHRQNWTSASRLGT